MNNLILGPLILYNNEEQLKGQIEDLYKEGWMPTLLTKTGPIFEHVMSKILLSKEQRKSLIGVVISFGYIKSYEA